MCFIFHSTGTVNMHNFLEPFLLRKREVVSESSAVGYGADGCPASGPRSVTAGAPVHGTSSLTVVVVIICYVAVL